MASTGKRAERKSRRRAALLVVLAVALALSLWRARTRPGPEAESSDFTPAGRWHSVRQTGGSSLDAVESPAAGVPDGSGDEARAESEARARLLSLPYLSGRRSASGAEEGVTVLDVDRAWPGANLYVSGHGPEVRLISLEGTLIRTWRMEFSNAFPGVPEDSGTAYFRRAALLPGGGVVAMYQGAGMIRLDRSGKLLWASPGAYFNDLYVTSRGTVWTLLKEARALPALGRADALEDFLVELDLETGRRQRSMSLLRAFSGTAFEAVMLPLGETPDIFHSNTVNELGHETEISLPFAPGQLLVSMREIDTVAVVDPTTERLVWAQRGPWKRQHDPTWIADGVILLFDNLGDRDPGAAAPVPGVPPTHSRALEWVIDPESNNGGTIDWRLRGLSSPEAGSCQRLPNGNTLIVESERGRAIEVTRVGEVVWEFTSPHRVGLAPRELVATLFDVVRVDLVSGESGAGAPRSLQ